MATSRICSRVLIYLLFILESKQIFASFVNIALHKPVYQSSYEDKNGYDPARAVDGVKHGDWHQCINTATNRKFTWFEVNLKNTYFVVEVKIYFRYDYKLRRNGVQVYANTAANASNTGHLCGSVTGSKNEIVNITCNVNARYVTVYQGTDNGASTALDFVELEVYTCQRGYYDSSCDKLCRNRHCQQNSSCPADTGSCTGGCQAGWTGSDCIQECTRNISYGPNCIKLCQNRHCALENPPCDIYRGDCGTRGCQAGWKGTDCIQACKSQSTYGPNCNKNCKDRHCSSTNAPCDVQYGNCSKGRCQAGWKGTDCTQECTSESTYGPNCNKTCKDRHCFSTNAPCDVQYGNCSTGGCQTGWKRADCTQECDKEVTYGRGCLKQCSERHCLNTSTCDTKTGECLGGCQAGWLEPDCSQECDNTYGIDCGYKCSDRNCKNDNSLCDVKTGECIGGCKPGWKGLSCTKSISTTPAATNMIIGIVVGLVVVIILVLVVVVVILRRRRRFKHESAESVDSNKTQKWSYPKDKPQEGNVYMNVAYTSRQEPEGDEISEEVKPIETSSVNVEADFPVEEVDEQDVEDERSAFVYYNINDFTLPGTGVSVSELSQVIDKIRHQPGGFDTEYKKLPTEFTSPYDESQITENKTKNRYQGYYPYDSNRVVLTLLPSIPHSDYINASYIDAYSVKNYFIAAQAPNRKTLPDFWRMIWEKDCGHIVMLTKLVEATKTKCEPYWSDTKTVNIGAFAISVIAKEERSDYLYRKFSVTHKKSGNSKTFQQYHFISWPDHGVPNVHDFVQFLLKVRKTKPLHPGPVVVHCSAGIGRTGTYIALDILLDELEATGRVDIRKVMIRLRDQRRGLVQTKEQYETVFTALLELATLGDTSLSKPDFLQKYPKEKGSLLMGKKTIDQLAEDVVSLNKTPYVETANEYQLWVGGRQDFFVLRMPSKASKQGYLLTPYKKATEEIFWKLVTENNSRTIITLSSEVMSKIIPPAGQTIQHGKTNITALRETSVIHEINEKTLHVETKGDKEKREIQHYCIHGWLPTTDSVTQITCLTTISEKLQQKEITKLPVTVVYRESEAKNALTLCIANNILSGIRLDSEVEIYNNVRRFQAVIPNVELTKDDFTFFCNLAFMNLESSSVYANCP